MDDFIKKLVKGDEKAFEKLVIEYQNRVYSVCLGMMKNPHDAQDAAQETFLKAYHRIRDFRGQSSIETWLTRIAMNACLDMIRLRSDTLPLVEGLDAADPMTVENRVLLTEQSRAVRKALDQLPPEQRSIVVLRDIQCYSYEEVCDILNLNMGTVRSRLHRAREKIKKIFMENGELF